MTADDPKRYKSILKFTNAHLQGYEPGGNVQTSRGPKFRDIISKLFPQSRRPRGVEVALRQNGRVTDNMVEQLYYEPGRPSGFLTLKQLHAAARDSKIIKVRLQAN